MVAVGRHSSLSALSSRLSRTLLGGRSFTFKYQLPNEDLDSLVSVSTDEDLENMIEQLDRLASSGSSVRIRLFLFFNKPETTASMGALLADSKSETWFVDALNGSGLVPRNLSDSAAIDTLLNIDTDAEAHAGDTEEDFSEQGKTNATTNDYQWHRNRPLAAASSPPPQPPDPNVAKKEAVTASEFEEDVVMNEENDEDYEIVEIDAVELLSEHIHICEICEEAEKTRGTP